jgi:tRNA(Ile)-lysidine synthase
VIERFKENIEKSGFLKKDDKLLLTVSGGVDSVVMVHLFNSIGSNFSIAHCNFKLRGEESEKDEEFVKKLAQEIGVDFFSKSFDTYQYARQKGISIQMAARDLRYQWFEEVRENNNFSFICVAHHKDDNAETVLINIIRGTGLAGLQGIREKRSFVVRPMWIFSRNEIERFAIEHKLDFRDDSSNNDTKYIRNKIRHRVLPVLREINPSINESFSRLSKIIRNTDTLLRYFIEKDAPNFVKQINDKVEIDIETLANYPSVEFILYELLKDYGFQPAVVENISLSLESQPGKRFYSPTYVCLKDRDKLVISPVKDQSDEILEVGKGQSEALSSTGKFVFTYRSDFMLEDLSGDSLEAFVDLSKIVFPLVIRHVKEGDFFYPIGMSGKKKLSDYLTDKKIPLTEKGDIWLLCSGEQIVWVVGMRPDERFKVKNASREVLAIKFIPYFE